jgi:hypothetical protein
MKFVIIYTTTRNDNSFSLQILSPLLFFAFGLLAKLTPKALELLFFYLPTPFFEFFV